MKKLSLFLFVIVTFITCLSNTSYAQPVPLYIQDAFTKAALPTDAKGRWVVKADVNIHKPNGETLAGGGDLELNGNVLSGDLALKVFNGSYIAGNTMYINILKSEPITVRVRHDIAGKPWLGRPAEVARLKNLYTTLFSQGKVMWDGEDCNISIYLSPVQVKGGPVGIRRPPPEPAKQPIGARYHITGLLEVTNAEDGVLGADNTCEIYGTIWIKLVDKDKKDYGARKVFTLVPQDAMKGFKLKFDGDLFFDRYFDEPNWSYFHIEGSIFDTDGGMANTGDHDLLWGTRKGFRFASLPTDPVGKVINQTIPGDRSSENAEVYITITKVKDLFVKP